jgi:hypothetical protein
VSGAPFPKEPLFDGQAFALEVRLAMARANLSYRGLATEIGSDQANIHRVAKHGKPPSIETFLRLRLWLDQDQQP